MAERSGFLGPFHIISYGTLLGSQAYQSLVGGRIAYRVLPRPQFATLQSSVFPIYFGLQTALPAIVAITYPGERTLTGSLPSGLAGVLAEEHRMSTLLPILTTFVAGITNMLLVGPAVNKTIEQRRLQETVDGKKSYDAPPHSKEMMRLNKSFGRLHGISAVLNLVGLFATVYYGKVLADRIN